MIAARRVGSCWYRSENAGRINVQIAAQRWIAELIEAGRITRGEKMLLEEMAKHADAKRTTQKSIAFLAKRCGVRDRTVQRYLRGLCPSKARHPEAWADRVLTRRFIHAAPEPGRKADNVPSWFTLEIPERFFAPRGPQKAAPRRPATAVTARSPGGVEIVTQAVIIGSGSTEITETLHPCSNLGPPPAVTGSAPPPPKPSPPPGQKQDEPPPLPPPVGGDLPVAVCAKLFPSHAPVAHRAVARLAALGWSEAQIVTYLRKASKDPGLAPGNARHPLWTAVWLAEKNFRSAPLEPRRTARQKPPDTPAPPLPPSGKAPIDPKFLATLAAARQALAAVEKRTGVSRPRSVQDLPPTPPETSSGPGGAFTPGGPKRPKPPS